MADSTSLPDPLSFSESRLRARFFGALSAEAVLERLAEMDRLASEVAHRYLEGAQGEGGWEGSAREQALAEGAAALEPDEGPEGQELARLMLGMMGAREGGELILARLQSRVREAVANHAPVFDAAVVREVVRGRDWGMVPLLLKRAEAVPVFREVAPEILQESWEGYLFAQSAEARIVALERIGSLVPSLPLSMELRRAVLDRLSRLPLHDPDVYRKETPLPWAEAGECLHPENPEGEAKYQEARALVRILVQDPRTPESALAAASPWIMDAAAGFWSNRAASHPEASPALWHRLLEAAPTPLLASRLGASPEVYTDPAFRARLLELASREGEGEQHPIFWNNLCLGAPAALFRAWWERLRQVDAVLALSLVVVRRADQLEAIPETSLDALLAERAVRVVLGLEEGEREGEEGTLRAELLAAPGNALVFRLQERWRSKRQQGEGRGR